MSQDFTLFKQRLEEAGMKKEQIENILEIAHNSIYPKKYGLVWEDKEEKIKEDLKLNLPYFKENKDRELKLGELNSPQHLLIEGDNYESLKLLQTTHRGKVNVIYIDPPYNTGKEFIYNDKLVDKEDGYRHSKWLSFMSKRLTLAKELLSEDGVIFISIDDNEFAQLKLLCDEIFGEKNFIANIIVKSNPRGEQSNKYIAGVHDYLLVYRKSGLLSLTGFKESADDIKKKYKNRDVLGLFEERELRKRGADSRREDSPTLYYPIYLNEQTNQITVEPSESCIEIYPKLSDGSDGRWRWSKETLSKKIDIVYARKKKNGLYNVYEKNYFKEDFNKKPTTIWDFDYVNTEKGSRLLKEILEKKMFDYPKPMEFIKNLVLLHPNTNAFVLDFFAGSGTTGHAVLELNKEDGGNRKFILCTNNENNICEEVTYERLKRVINGYTTPKGKKVEGIPAKLKYLKVEMIEKDTYTSEDLSYIYMPHVLPLLQLKHNAFSLVAQSEGAVVYEKEGFRFGVASDLAINSDFELLSKHLKRFEGEKVLYLFSTDTHSYPKYQQLAELDGIIQPIPREILNLLKGE